jgi:zinc and cadmium transporter
MIWVYALGSVAAISLISVAGIGTLSLGRKQLHRTIHCLVSFAVGSLFGGAFIHLIPEIFTDPAVDHSRASLYVILGILIFFVLEKYVRWRHCHDIDCEEHARHLVALNLVGDSLHNFIDGLIIGTAYLVDVKVGVATTIAVAFHELPQEIGDFGVLIHAGLTPKRALLYNFLTALTAFVGVFIALLIGSRVDGFITALLPVTVGGFIYIAGSDLIPELHHQDDPTKSISQLMFMILGVLVMWGLKVAL